MLVLARGEVHVILHRYLGDEHHEDDHAHTRNDVGVVLDDEFLAQNRRSIPLVATVPEALHFLLFLSP